MIFFKLLQLDLKNIRRDLMLALLVPVPLFLALVLRFSFNPIAGLFSSSIELQSYGQLILIFLFVMGPLLTGMISGLIFVDEADEQILSVISITPLGKNKYLIHRLMTPFLWSFFSLLLVPILIGFNNMNYLLYLPIIFLASLGSILEAMIIAVLAKNKIEAMAIGKMTGIMFLSPFLAWYLPYPWKYLSSLIPSFWVSESFILLNKGSFFSVVLFIGGVFVHVILITLLLRVFNKRFD